MYHDPQLVRQWFAYDPISGTLTRKLKRRVHHPDIINPNRERVDFFGFKYRITHIIWAIHYGRWPKQGYEIDHKDHNIHNNKLENLREATRSENARNRRWINPNGKGVTYCQDKNSPWQAQIAIDGQKIHLGFCDSKEEAAEAYRQAALKYHGEFACLE